MYFIYEECGGSNSCIPAKTVRPPTSYECEDSYCINTCKDGVYPCTNSGMHFIQMQF